MLYVLASAIGVIIGSVVTQFLVHRKSGYGYFITKKINDEEQVVNVRIPNPADQELHKKKTIILKNESSSN